MYIKITYLYYELSLNNVIIYFYHYILHENITIYKFNGSPSGEDFSPFTSPRGENLPHPHPLMEEFPAGNRGSGPIAISRPVWYTTGQP
jgi:hypothetical protein